MQSISLRPRGSVVEASSSGQARRRVEPSDLDRRGGARLKTMVTALVTVPGGADAPLPKTCLDLSATGMVFTFKRALRIRSSIIATLKLPDGNIETTASVVRCERARRPGWWKIAVKFDDLFEDDQQRIAEYVAQESENRFGW